MNAEFEHCIRCTICVENCPVFKVDKDYPGPKQAGPDAARFRLDGEEAVDEWVSRCAQCKRCEVACPYGVNPAEIIQHAQLNYSQKHGTALTNKLFANNYYLGALGSIMAPITNMVTAHKGMQKLFKRFGISTYMEFPKFHFQTLKRSWRKKGKGQKKVAFFHGCYLDNNAPDLGRSMRDLMASMGIRVVIPKQVCCGLPTLANGDLAGAKRFARKNASILATYIDKGYDVIYACTSCGLSLTHDYPGILEAPQGKKIAENTYNIHEYILNLIEEGYITPSFKEINKTIAYHIPCHLRSMGIGYPAAELLRMIRDLRSKESRHPELIELFELEPFLNKKLGNLSGGTKQKVNLVLAFMFESDLILLDEPTAGLDPISLIHLRDLFQQERSKGRTIIVTTHIMSFAEEISDEIVFVLDGKIHFKGSVDQIQDETGQSTLETAIAALLRASRP